MNYDKNSIEYQLNMESFYEMDEYVPMTRAERDALFDWVKKGYDIESNPWDYLDWDEAPLNYLQAYRLEHGYSGGPWDNWKGYDNWVYLDDTRKRIISKDDLLD